MQQDTFPNVSLWVSNKALILCQASAQKPYTKTYMHTKFLCECRSRKHTLERGFRCSSEHTNFKSISWVCSWSVDRTMHYYFFLRSCFTGSRKVLTRFGMSHYGADTTFHFYLSIRELLVAKQLCLWWHHSLHALLCILSFQLTHRIASWRRNEQLRGNIEILLTQQAFRPCIVHSGTWKRDDSEETMNTFALAVAPF